MNEQEALAHIQSLTVAELVDNYGLELRTANHIERDLRILWVRDLLNCSERELRLIPSIGPKRTRHIISILRKVPAIAYLLEEVS